MINKKKTNIIKLNDDEVLGDTNTLYSAKWFNKNNNNIIYVKDMF